MRSYQKEATEFLSAGNYFDNPQTRQLMLDMLFLTVKENLVTAQVLFDLVNKDSSLTTILTDVSFYLLSKNYSEELVTQFFTGFRRLLIQTALMLQSYEDKERMSFELYEIYARCILLLCESTKAKIN
jgi:hypothetical protein